jgi:hypothetical protein
MKRNSPGDYLSGILIPTATAYPLLDHINIGFPTKHTIDRGLKNIEETPIHWVHFGNVSYLDVSLN